jgi:hypothetical protein
VPALDPILLPRGRGLVIDLLGSAEALKVEGCPWKKAMWDVELDDPEAGSVHADDSGRWLFTPTRGAEGLVVLDVAWWCVGKPPHDVTLDVQVDGRPTAEDARAETPEDHQKELVFKGTDPDAQAVSFQLVVPPAHGAIELVGDVALDGSTRLQTARYTPAADWFGSDSACFVAVDPTGWASRPALVTLSVTPQPEAVAGDPGCGAAEPAWAKLPDGREFAPDRCMVRTIGLASDARKAEWLAASGATSVCLARGEAPDELVQGWGEYVVVVGATPGYAQLTATCSRVGEIPGVESALPRLR